MRLHSNLLAFMLQGGEGELRRVLYLSLFSGFASTALVALVNKAAGDVSRGMPVTFEFFLFAAVLLLYFFILRKSSEASIASAQNLVHRFRMRIVDRVFRSDLERVDGIGRVDILQKLGRDAQMVSTAMPAILSVGQAVATLAGLTVYMAVISMVVPFVILAAVVAILAIAVPFVLRSKGVMDDAWAREGRLYEVIDDFLAGYQEVKMNSARARDVQRDILEQGLDVTRRKTAALTGLTQYFTQMQVMLYLVVGAMVFVVPALSDRFEAVVVPVATATIFLVGTLTGLIGNIPNLIDANTSAGGMLALERRLDEAGGAAGADASGRPGKAFGTGFRTIALRDVCFSHHAGSGAGGFAFGPVSCEFHAGRIYFIRGANGSGKTTLFRLLLGLYRPDAGHLEVDGEPLDQPAPSAYRDLFAAVFSDFHLFRRLYGVSDPGGERLAFYRSAFGIDGKLSVEAGRFADLSLSTGQRKRVALLVAMLEARPIVVLDEWAADQDPEFRHEFYTRIVPGLRAEGKTVIAITHDDAYYGVADHLLTMRNGRLVEA